MQTRLHLSAHAHMRCIRDMHGWARVHESHGSCAALRPLVWIRNEFIHEIQWIFSKFHTTRYTHQEPRMHTTWHTYQKILTHTIRYAVYFQLHTTIYTYILQYTLIFYYLSLNSLICISMHLCACTLWTSNFYLLEATYFGIFMKNFFQFWIKNEFRCFGVVCLHE